MKINTKKVIYILLAVGVIAILTTYVKPIIIANNNLTLDEDNLAMARKSRSRESKLRNTKITTTSSTTNSTTTSTQDNTNIGNTTTQTNTSSTNNVFFDNFDSDYTIEEDGDINSNNTKWWVNSGAYLYSSNGNGSTILGDLSSINPWRVAFYLANPLDTDNGYHPQNIFRLVQKDLWKNLSQEAYFKIVKNNLSISPNRNASNGLLLFNRYLDEYSLYYTGIRVDGYAVIKKKLNGTYYTMDYKPVFNGKYDVSNNPNLIPLDTWIGLRSEVKTNSDGTVNIKLYMDNGKTGNWVLVAEATDNGKDFGNGAITDEGYAGIRTDFMDVLFDDYKISSL